MSAFTCHTGVLERQLLDVLQQPRAAAAAPSAAADEAGQQPQGAGADAAPAQAAGQDQGQVTEQRYCTKCLHVMV